MITGLFELRYDMPLLEFIGAVCHGSLKGLAMRLINGEFFHRTCYKVNKITSQQRSRMLFWHFSC